MAELADLLREVADGALPDVGSDLIVIPPPDPRSVGVLAFTGCSVVSVDAPDTWVRHRLPTGDPAAPLASPFLSLLAAATGREPENLDVVLVARGNGRASGLDLTPLSEADDHPRVRRAEAHRTGVVAWRCAGGLLVLGRGVAGRWEVAVEVDPVFQGFGLGRGLFGAALGLVPAGEPVWAQIAPGNAQSMRAALGAGFQPVGAEVLLAPPERLADPGGAGDFGWFRSEGGAPPGEPGEPGESGEPGDERRPDEADHATDAAVQLPVGNLFEPHIQVTASPEQG